MARGNQRDKAREKNLKKKEAETKGAKKDGNAFKREQESNAEIMRRKQAEAEARKSGTTTGGA